MRRFEKNAIDETITKAQSSSVGPICNHLKEEVREPKRSGSASRSGM